MKNCCCLSFTERDDGAILQLAAAGLEHLGLVFAHCSEGLVRWAELVLLGGHDYFRYGDRVAIHLARQPHSVTSVLLQSPEVLVAEVVDITAADKYVFGAVLFHTGQHAVAIGHLLGAMFG